MDNESKFTDLQDELCFFDLVSGDNILAIPLFQRPYSWQKQHLDQFLADINDIFDGNANSAFLGTITCTAREHNPGRPKPWEVVDGQQRLSTLYLLLMASAETLARHGAIRSAAGILATYLLVRPFSDNPINTKLVPCYADRAQFRAIWDQLMSNQALAYNEAIVANPPKTPPPSGETKGPMLSQYLRMRAVTDKLYKRQGKEALEKYVEIVANRLSMVTIRLRIQKAAPSTFERLNGRGVQVTTADLVKNEVFSRSTMSQTDVGMIFSTHWEPFAREFGAAIKGRMDRFLLPYGVILHPRVKKSELFVQICSYWKNLPGPLQIIEDMKQYVDVFLALECGQPSSQLDAETNKLLLRLHRLGKPLSIYAFVMRLGLAIKTQEVALEVGHAILRVIEDFFFRRAVCGIESTGVYSVFRGLWSEFVDDENITCISADGVKSAIATRAGVAWPDDAQFKDSVIHGDLYRRKVCQFALREYESACKGDSSSDDFAVEHVLPQTLTEDWEALFGHEHAKLCNTWANLVPLSPNMNPSVGQGGYAQKRAAYKDSMYSSARALATQYGEWTLQTLNQRAHALADWAVLRWPTCKP